MQQSGCEKCGLTTLVFTVGEHVEPEIVALGLSARMWTLPDLSQEITSEEDDEGRLSIRETA